MILLLLLLLLKDTKRGLFATSVHLLITHNTVLHDLTLMSIN
jgi:hypothetical protein